MYAFKPQDHRAIRLQLENARRVEQGRYMLSLYWGIILAKCLLVEWSVRVYEMPFNSLYLWAPTLLLSVIATIIYWKALYARSGSLRLAPTFVTAIWAGAAATISVITIGSVASATITADDLPPIGASLTGFALFVSGIQKHHRLSTVLGLLWWLFALMLFTAVSHNSFLYLAIGIFALHTLPFGAEMLVGNWKRRVGEKQKAARRTGFDVVETGGKAATG